MVPPRSNDREKFFLLHPEKRIEFKCFVLAISTGWLNPLLGLHRQPINLVVSKGPFFRASTERIPYLGMGFPLEMLSAVIPNQCGFPAMLLMEQLAHQGLTHPGPLVLWANSLKYPTLTADRDRAVLQRSEPSSRRILMGEQTNPWGLIQPQDILSRHRGREPGRRYGLSGPTTLLSLA